MEGTHCRIEPFDLARDAKPLFEAYRADTDNRSWAYLPYGPFDDFESYYRFAEGACLGNDPMVHTIVDRATETPLGVASYMRIDPPNGVIEVGGIHYAPALQRTVAGTEAMYLMMKRVFDDLGYRRYEWKCNALNAPSRRAAKRYGFTFEGVFRQAAVVKGRNRDTAWFAIVDGDWPAIKTAFETWLSPENRDAEGRQKQGLSQFMPG